MMLSTPKGVKNHGDYSCTFPFKPAELNTPECGLLGKIATSVGFGWAGTAQNGGNRSNF